MFSCVLIWTNFSRWACLDSEGISHASSLLGMGASNKKIVSSKTEHELVSYLRLRLPHQSQRWRDINALFSHDRLDIHFGRRLIQRPHCCKGLHLALQPGPLQMISLSSLPPPPLPLKSRESTNPVSSLSRSLHSQIALLSSRPDSFRMSTCPLVSTDPRTLSPSHTLSPHPPETSFDPSSPSLWETPLHSALLRYEHGRSPHRPAGLEGLLGCLLRRFRS